MCKTFVTCVPCDPVGALSAACPTVAESIGRGHHPRKKADTARLWAVFPNKYKKFDFLRFSVFELSAIFAENARVNRQAGERVGAANGTRPDTQRPEMPTARAFFGFGNGIHHGAVLRPMVPNYGAKTPVLLRITRCYRWRIAIKMRKERNIMKNCRNVRISPLIEAADLYDPGGGMGLRMNESMNA